VVVYTALDTEFSRPILDDFSAHSGVAVRPKFDTESTKTVGLADTDDAIEEQRKELPVAIVYPDQQSGGIGALFIPNTLAVIKGSPNPVAARRLVDHLLSPEVEAKLAAGPSAQIPLNTANRAKAQVETPHTIKATEVDFQEAAEKWDTAAKFLRELFTGG
jgi:iron(III) transport system substrate-binding protein